MFSLRLAGLELPRQYPAAATCGGVGFKSSVTVPFRLWRDHAPLADRARLLRRSIAQFRPRRSSAVVQGRRGILCEPEEHHPLNAQSCVLAIFHGMHVAVRRLPNGQCDPYLIFAAFRTRTAFRTRGVRATELPVMDRKRGPMRDRRTACRSLLHSSHCTAAFPPARGRGERTLSFPFVVAARKMGASVEFGSHVLGSKDIVG